MFFPKSILTPATTMDDVLGLTVSKRKIILPIKIREKLIESLRNAIWAEWMSKWAQRILGLTEAAHSTHRLDQRKVGSKWSSAVDSGSHDPTPIFPEEFDSYDIGENWCINMVVFDARL